MKGDGNGLPPAYWSGGPFAVSKRMRVSVARNPLKVALTGASEHAGMAPHPASGVLVPVPYPGVPVKLLDAHST